MKKYFTKISIQHIEFLGGGFGMGAVVRGMGVMRAWCADNTTGYKYQRRSCRFEFVSMEHKTAFDTHVAAALAIPEALKAD